MVVEALVDAEVLVTQEEEAEKIMEDDALDILCSVPAKCKEGICSQCARLLLVGRPRHLGSHSLGLHSP